MTATVFNVYKSHQVNNKIMQTTTTVEMNNSRFKDIELYEK